MTDIRPPSAWFFSHVPVARIKKFIKDNQIMPNYHRFKIPHAQYFFTVNLLNRKSQLLTEHIELLREAFRKIKKERSFEIKAIVILPEHLHCIWQLPQKDADYSTRWRLIKSYFSKRLPDVEKRSDSCLKRKERGIWQRRFWEHMIRDERDYQHHVDYIHYNPVKHQWVKRVADWPYSSYHHQKGLYLQRPTWQEEITKFNIGEEKP